MICWGLPATLPSLVPCVVQLCSDDFNVLNIYTCTPAACWSYIELSLRQCFLGTWNHVLDFQDRSPKGLLKNVKRVLSHFDPEHIPFSVEEGHHFLWSSNAFVQTKPNIHRLELRCLHKELHPFVASNLTVLLCVCTKKTIRYLLFWHKNQVNCPLELLPLLLQSSHGLNVLDAHTFHVLQEGDLQI